MNKKIIKIMYLAHLIQERTEYCTFIDYSGHVNSLDLHFSESKEKYDNKLLNVAVRFNDNEERLDTIIDKLEEILNDKEIDFIGLDYEVEEIYHYYI